MINFVKVNASTRGARHMELRLFYTREEYYKGRVNLEHRSGKILTTDKLTKLGNVEEHRRFAADIQGLILLGYDYYNRFSTAVEECKADSM
jgi:hypothetical protein